MQKKLTSLPHLTAIFPFKKKFVNLQFVFIDSFVRVVKQLLLICFVKSLANIKEIQMKIFVFGATVLSTIRLMANTYSVVKHHYL